MPPDPLLDEEEQYASSEDSDFAPDAAVDQASDHSESEDDGDKPTKKRKPVANAEAADAGYDNSGDEAIIKKGEKRRKKKSKRVDDDDEGGEGGLIKTRRQRAAEKEERKYATNTEPVTIDVDALWAQMVAGPAAKTDEAQDGSGKQDTEAASSSEIVSGKKSIEPATSDDPSAMIRIKRTYNFAGRVHTEEKLVHRDSAEAKLYLASQAPDAPTEEPAAKRVTRKAFRSAFEPLIDPLPQRADLNLGMAARIKAGKEAQATKLNTVEKSRMDWAGYVDKEGIKDELELAGKSKDSYTAREDFLARSEAKRDEDSRRARMAGRWGSLASHHKAELSIAKNFHPAQSPVPTTVARQHTTPELQSDMAVLGKRKAREEPSISQEDAAAIFRRHFEAQFSPLPAGQAKAAKAALADEDDEEDEGSEVDDEGDQEDEDEDDDWGGLSEDESNEDEDAIEVVDHSVAPPPKPTLMSKREHKAFMSSRPPDQTSQTAQQTTTTTSSSTVTLPEDAPTLLAQDLELRRLLAESHLLAPALTGAGTPVAPKAFAAGRTRQKATDLRVQALGSKVSIHKQEKMPMNMRKGIVAAAGARETKRRREAKENGVILERETGKKMSKRRDRGGDMAVDRPGVGRLRGAELRISESDVRGIEVLSNCDAFSHI
ncbi:hypothetical protein G7Z17_g13256 [Cylindrodendrum hubeiense]|uniref:SWR1-complex protein 5 n=1 Tax=Cylindrodendrum hubeiense TaxID=595255 RepID=A0A9P5GW65_9HYPO|nr:hypothetical protein G7Z17_g13256 [Cylindrodendrum hubeiense]